MRLDQLLYWATYCVGGAAWDTGEPRPEVRGIVASGGTGRALDLGCGTGADAVYLAQHGWQVVGVDFAPAAIEAARRRASTQGVRGAEFVVGDVSRLRAAGVTGLFDLLIDVGCYHAVPARLRDAYAAEAAAVARAGADFYVVGTRHPAALWRVFGAQGVSAADLRRRFGAWFDLVAEEDAGPLGRASQLAILHLRRT